MTNPDRLLLTSLDITEDRKALLRKSFPEVFREDKIDFDALQRALGESVDPCKERFGLNWPGKAACSKLIQQASVGTLLPMREQSVDFDSTENLIIEGDNLEVLKLLQKSYYGKVKMIYIDPPYNTGNEFIYPDNFHEGLQDYLKYSGQVDGEGRKQSSNTETGGRYHSNWLSMMYPRLFLARNLLREDGVIFISINYRELANLLRLCDELFGEENFVGNVTWKARVKPVNIGEAKYRPQGETEYVVIYQKSNQEGKFQPLYTGGVRNYPHDFNGRKYRLTTILKSNRGANFRNTMSFEIDGYAPPEGQRWQGGKEEINRLSRDGYLEFRDGTPFKRYFEDEEGDEHDPFYCFMNSDWSSTSEAGKSELNELLGDNHGFDTVKPTRLLTTLIQSLVAPSKNEIILDFFAGSGTTAQAVLDLNQVDKGNRKFILVQLPEPTDNPAYPTIADITRERVRRVSARLKETPAAPDLLSEASENVKPDLGFKAMRLASSNFKVWDGRADQMTDVGATLQMFAEHVLPGRTAEDILHELLLKTGYPLTTPLTVLTLAGKQVFSASEGALLICLEHELSLEAIEAMVARDPWLILCLDAGFAGQDQLKANAMQTVRAHNRNRQSSMSLKVV